MKTMKTTHKMPKEEKEMALLAIHEDKSWRSHYLSLKMAGASTLGDFAQMIRTTLSGSTLYSVAMKLLTRLTFS